jgi:3D-(3,5/4)-trihydroxycyclohexane-1,2-dione acylhydrolase (decyclizing)
LDGDILPVDLATNAESLGADVIRVTGIEEFRKALDVARAATKTTVIHIDTDPVAPVPSSESWWDVPVSQVSDLDSTQRAYQTYQQHKATQRSLITPNTFTPSAEEIQS